MIIVAGSGAVSMFQIRCANKIFCLFVCFFFVFLHSINGNARTHYSSRNEFSSVWRMKVKVVRIRWLRRLN